MMIVNAFTSMPASDLHISWLIPIHQCTWHDLMPYHPSLSLTIKHCSLKLSIHAIHHHISWPRPIPHCPWPSNTAAWSYLFIPFIITSHDLNLSIIVPDHQTLQHETSTHTLDHQASQPQTTQHCPNLPNLTLTIPSCIWPSDRSLCRWTPQSAWRGRWSQRWPAPGSGVLHEGRRWKVCPLTHPPQWRELQNCGEAGQWPHTCSPHCTNKQCKMLRGISWSYQTDNIHVLWWEPWWWQSTLHKKRTGEPAKNSPPFACPKWSLHTGGSHWSFAVMDFLIHTLWSYWE